MSTIPTRRELMAWFVAFAMIAALTISLQPGVAQGAYRDEGQQPNTGAPLSEAATPVPDVLPDGTPRTVYIATGLNFPDALGAGSAAGVAMGPILLVHKDFVPAETLAELTRLKPNVIVIVGGTGAVSDAVESDLTLLPWNHVTKRIAGTNRYDTAALLSADVFPTTGFYPQTMWAELNNDHDVEGTGGPQVVLTTSHTAEIAGIYVITAGADLYATGSSDGDTNVSCYIAVDGIPLGPSWRQMEFNNTDNSEENCATQGVFVANTYGFHTFTLVVIDAALGIYIDERSLIVTWQPNRPGS